MTNEETVRAWLKGTRGLGRNSNNTLKFSGNVICSHGDHFPMARLATANGKRVCLITSRRYSRTTSRHTSLVAREASRAGFRLIRVPHVTPQNRGAHVDNVKALAALDQSALVLYRTIEG